MTEKEYERERRTGEEEGGSTETRGGMRGKKGKSEARIEISRKMRTKRDFLSVISVCTLRGELS